MALFYLINKVFVWHQGCIWYIWRQIYNHTKSLYWLVSVSRQCLLTHPLYYAITQKLCIQWALKLLVVFSASFGNTMANFRVNCWVVAEKNADRQTHMDEYNVDYIASAGFCIDFVIFYVRCKWLWNPYKWLKIVKDLSRYSKLTYPRMQRTPTRLTWLSWITSFVVLLLSLCLNHWNKFSIFL